jgi:hypothetical protein
MKFANLKYTLLSKIKIAFTNIWKAMKQLQNREKAHDPETYTRFLVQY